MLCTLPHALSTSICVRYLSTSVCELLAVEWAFCLLQKNTEPSLNVTVVCSKLFSVTSHVKVTLSNVRYNTGKSDDSAKHFLAITTYPLIKNSSHAIYTRINHMYTFQHKLILPMYTEYLNIEPRHSSPTLFLRVSQTYLMFKTADTLHDVIVA